jgi:enoyl-CoA hydratase/carnithine racemase
MQLKTEKMIAEKEDGIGWMTFNQPERRNAISQEMREAILAILDDFETDPSVRVIVMKGAGDKAFVSPRQAFDRHDPGLLPRRRRGDGALRGFAHCVRRCPVRYSRGQARQCL